MVLTTNAEWYPWWEGEVELCVGGGQVPEVRYKYVVKGPQGDKWEDAIADRTVACDAKSGILGEGLTTFIDDGELPLIHVSCRVPSWLDACVVMGHAELLWCAGARWGGF